jgi:putative DNA primase/helicase
MQAFAEFVRSAGLLVDYVSADGKWHRVPTEDHPKRKNGSYKLADDGLVGWAQNFAIHSEPLTWRPEREYQPPKIDGAAVARKRNEDRRALVKATQAAREFYLSCEPLRGGHQYLESHCLTMTGCYGLKLDPDGWLVVPIRLDGNLLSVQRISPEGEKRFWPGASVKSGSYLIERRGAQITILCEGLATGLAIFAAAPATRIVVAFNSGNLAKVQIPRRGLVVVAADNDHQTAERIGHNPGLDAAQAAAEALGCGVAVPFGMSGSDWCDYRNDRLHFMWQGKPQARESEIKRAVDAEIAAAIMKNAVFLRGH